MRDCDRCDQQLLLTVTVPALVPGQPASSIGLCARCDRHSGPAAEAIIAYQQKPRHEWDDREHIRLAVAWMNEVNDKRSRLGLDFTASTEEESFAQWETEFDPNR